jgi:hypothetical protein
MPGHAGRADDQIGPTATGAFSSGASVGPFAPHASAQMTVDVVGQSAAIVNGIMFIVGGIMMKVTRCQSTLRRCRMVRSLANHPP